MNSMSGGAFTVLFLSTHLLLTLGQQYFPLTDYYPSYPGAYGVMGMMRPPPVTQPPPYPAWNYQRVGMGPYQHMYATPNLYARGTSQYTYGSGSYAHTYHVPNPAPSQATDMRHSGNEFASLWFMCSSKNCGRGKRRR
ncbi:hypothetical protein DdX_12774 [Ditylenchus destructor]|uniref:Uncharacterized protein n=1 Tax=Ditylenchus destructor TaxID=166010 RepID=A0AAD4MZZ9_9BILA|nr:hypothetical protein DdX_12774 [Ditylenchus destructor]